MTVSQTFLVFDDLDSLRSTGQVFCRMSLNRDLSDDSLITGVKLQDFFLKYF